MKTAGHSMCEILDVRPAKRLLLYLGDGNIELTNKRVDRELR